MAVFSARDSATGFEPHYFVESTSTAHLMADINVGSGHSNPRTWVEWNSRLYFQASDGTDTDLYEWNPSSPGTAPSKVAASQENPNCALCENIAIVDGSQLIYINGAGSSRTAQVRTYDGTSTQVISTHTFYDMEFAVRTSHGVFVSALDNSGTYGIELWKISGGTVSLEMDINPGSSNSKPEYIVANGDDLYFSCIPSGNSAQLCKYDTAAQSFSDLSSIKTAGYTLPGYLTINNGRIFMRIFDNSGPSEGYELGVLNVASDTMSAYSLKSGSGSSKPKGFMVRGSNVYFWADSSSNGQEIFFTDGTSAPQLLGDNDVYGADLSSSVVFPAGALTNSLVYQAYSPTGYALYQYNLA